MEKSENSSFEEYLEEHKFSFELNSCFTVMYVAGEQVAKTIGKYQGVFDLDSLGEYLVLSDCDGDHFINIDTIVAISVINKSSLDKITEDEKDPQKQLIARVCKCK
jgi:hypothetical protein